MNDIFSKKSNITLTKACRSNFDLNTSSEFWPAELVPIPIAFLTPKKSTRNYSPIKYEAISYDTALP